MELMINMINQNIKPLVEGELTLDGIARYKTYYKSQILCDKIYEV